MLERDFQKKIIAYLKENKIYHFKTIATNKKGTPDIIGCYKGKFFGIECKALKNKGASYSKASMKSIFLRFNLPNKGVSNNLISLLTTSQCLRSAIVSYKSK
ncbi:hypothetical protein KVL89_07565 [Helicobacter pylori]|nr:hypothetical protein KVL89_07565 [Helicobacter pylori]